MNATDPRTIVGTPANLPETETPGTFQAFVRYPYGLDLVDIVNVLRALKVTEPDIQATVMHFIAPGVLTHARLGSELPQG